MECLLNLEGQKEDETDFTFLVNNTVRDEVERIIEFVGIKEEIIAIKAEIKENIFSQWRTRKTSFNFKQLEKITEVIARFKDFLD